MRDDNHPRIKYGGPGIGLFRLFAGLPILFIFFACLAASPAFGQAGDPPTYKVASPGGYEALAAKINSKGSARLIVGVNVQFRPMASPESAESISQMNTISITQDNLLAELSGMNYAGVHKYSFIPYMVMEADDTVLNALLTSSTVTSIHEDIAVPATLDLSVPRIGAAAARSLGYTGSGVTLAVLDTGVDKTHPFLSGAVVSEACYSSTVSGDGSTSACPGGATGGLTSSGSALPYAGNCPAGSCDHGTHVAGIAAGRQAAAGSAGPGVAPNASIIAIQVFSRFDNLPGCTPSTCACGSSPCVLAYDSDVLRGLERIYALRSTYTISSINLSLGGGQYSNQSTCDTDMSGTKAAIDNLRAAGIATVISSGNSSYCGSMGKPGCISSAVSVGATTDPDGVANYSNSASFLNLLAPGSDIISSIPGGAYARYWGTSMAAPHITGAWALMKQAQPSATVDSILNAFTSTGLSITDSKCGSVTKRRINVNEALSKLRSTPYVQAAAATNIGLNLATLNGTARANTPLYDASISFQYGTTTSYGSSASATPATVTGTTNYPAIASLTGLSPNTLYHYRVRGSSPYGTSYSDDMTFVTSGTCGSIQSGDLEGYLPLPGWTEAASHCITPLCNVFDNPEDCAPHSGYGAALFGCFILPEIESITQTVTIPKNSPQSLQFYLWNTSASWNETDSFSVLMDGWPILSVFESDPLYGGGYARVILDLSPYADGGPHSLSLYSALSGSSSFLVDDISMSCSKGSVPYVETGDVIPVDAYEINLTGTVNAFGTRTTVSFDYGTTDAYGHSVSAEPAAVGINGDYPVTSNPPFVSSGTIYHYRIRGQSSSGIAYGRDMSFMTYCSSAAARILSTPFTSIQSAVNNAIGGSTVMVNNAAFTENLTVGGSGSIKLMGGYDCTFSSAPGFSTIKGKITFGGSRSVTVENFIVQ